MPAGFFKQKWIKLISPQFTTRQSSFFALLALSLANSTNAITIQPKGYGKCPKKKAKSVVINNVTSKAAIQSILIVVSLGITEQIKGEKAYTKKPA